MRPLLLALLLLTLAWARPACATEPEVTAESLMRTVFSSHATYKGMKTVIFWSKRGSDAVICKTYQQGDAIRFEYLPSPHRPARIVVQNRKYVWYYQPAKKLLITEERSGGDEDRRMLDIAFKNYDWEVEGDAVVAGHHTKILKSAQKQTGTVQQRLWIDTRHDVVLRKESYNIRGELYFVSYFTEIEYPGSLDPDLFALTMPSDTKEVIRKVPVLLSADPGSAARVGFTPVFHDNMPGGYELLGMELETLTGHRAIRLTYSDGLDVVSLVEMPANLFSRSKDGSTRSLEALGRNLQFEALQEGNLLQWRDDRIFYTLVGAVPQDEMLAMYNDLMPPVGAAGPTGSAQTPPHTLMYYFWRGLERLSRIGR